MRRHHLLLVIVLALLAIAGPGASQQGKGTSGVKPPDQQQIENSIGEMLAGWQIGDTDLMRRYYADDVLVVSGAYEAPVIGWGNYLTAYKTQRQRMVEVRLERINTFIKLKGDLAWASYQWEFSATADGRPMMAQGQATLLFEKRGDRWLIIHNHTSVVNVVVPQQPQAPANPGSK